MNNDLPESNPAVPSDLLGEAVNKHLAVFAEEPAPDFQVRCQAAALGALDVLKMRSHRARLANQPGSLLEHFEALARQGGVSLDHVFTTLNLARVEPANATAIRRLARLARLLGLAHEETVRRFRWGFAKFAGIALPTTWDNALLSVRARRKRGTVRRQDPVEMALRRSEATYPASRRAELRAAVNVVLEEYGNLTD